MGSGYQEETKYLPYGDGTYNMQGTYSETINMTQQCVFGAE